jgi:hypothetical protein
MTRWWRSSGHGHGHGHGRWLHENRSGLRGRNLLEVRRGHRDVGRHGRRRDVGLRWPGRRLVHYLSARVRVAALDIPRLTMRCAATGRGAVAIDDAVWHDVVLLLLDFDETHGAFSVPCDRKVGNSIAIAM